LLFVVMVTGIISGSATPLPSISEDRRLAQLGQGR